MLDQPKQVSLTNSLTFAYSFSIQSLERDWLQTKVDTIYLQPSYLKALENSLSDKVTFIYVVVYQDKLPIGVVYFQWIRIGGDFFTQEKFPNEIHSKLTSSVLKRVKGSLLLCGNFFATGVHGFYFNSDLPASTLSLLVKKLKKQLCASKTIAHVKFVMYKEFWLNQDVALQENLLKTHACFQIDVNMVLEIKEQWTGLDTYLESMTTKYRTRAKSVYKKTAVLSSKEFSAKEIQENFSIIQRLYQSVLDTASFNMVELSVASFYEFKVNLKENFIFTGYYKDDALVAFSTACVNHHYLDANYVGLDYELNKEIPVYQRILYDYVQLALRKKVVELRLGRTAELMKSSLGAVPKEMNLYIKHSNPLLHTLLKPLTHYVKPSTYEIRKPFKKSFYQS